MFLFPLCTDEMEKTEEEFEVLHKQLLNGEIDMTFFIQNYKKSSYIISQASSCPSFCKGLYDVQKTGRGMIYYFVRMVKCHGHFVCTVHFHLKPPPPAPIFTHTTIQPYSYTATRDRIVSIDELDLDDKFS